MRAEDRTSYAGISVFGAGLLWAAGYALDSTDPYRTQDLFFLGPWFLYALAYACLINAATQAYILYAGPRADLQAWRCRLGASHAALLLLWIPARLYQIEQEMDHSLQFMTRQNLRAIDGVFASHPSLGILYLQDVYEDESRPENERLAASDIQSELQDLARERVSMGNPMPRIWSCLPITSPKAFGVRLPDTALVFPAALASRKAVSSHRTPKPSAR